MKILVIVNEDIGDMVLGVNSTLSYIISAGRIASKIFIYKISDNGEINSSLSSLSLSKDDINILAKEYTIQNNILSQSLKNHNIRYCKTTVSSYIKNFSREDILASDIDFVIQRLEPMKTPFPPFGNINIENYLESLKKILPSKLIFNFPINSYKDKEFPLLFDFATPTEVSSIDDRLIFNKIKIILKRCNTNKIVIKPDDSAQAFGVFSIEFCKNGLNLESLFNNKLSVLASSQKYKISDDLNNKDFDDVIKILLYVQYWKSIKNNSDVFIKEKDSAEIKFGGEKLYDKKILIQPFLEGVAKGDIRISVAKDEDEMFKVVAAIFRKIVINDSDNFTTGFMSGRSMPFNAESCLTKIEFDNLLNQTNIILSYLNLELKELYKNVLEIGFDFILAGDNENVFFGEANHHCQGLIPLAEVIDKSEFYDKTFSMKYEFDGGLGITKKIISQQIKLQNKIL